MQNLTEHEKKILKLVKKYPAIVKDRNEREKIAVKHGLKEKTLRNRIADLKKYGLINFDHKRQGLLNSPIQERDTVNDINLLDYISILWKWKKLITINVVVVTLLTVVVTLIMPKTFRASAVLMPPSSNSNMGILGTLSELPFGNLIPSSTDETMSFIAILKSRTVMENVIEKFNLIKFYEVENVEDALEMLNDNVIFEVENEGTISISADVSTGWLHPNQEEEWARQLSADLANYFVNQLDLINKNLKTREAKFQRVFIGERYKQNLEELRTAEDNLKVFQEKNKMISLPEQTKEAIAAASFIQAQILANEVQLEVMNSTLNSDHPDIKRIKKETEELKSQLRKMEYGTSGSQSNQDNLFPIFSDVPELGIQLLRYEREVEIQNTLFSFLTQQYEEAKIQEAKDTPTVQVLDVAKIPINKFKPRRTLIVVLSFMVSLIITVGALLIYQEYNLN